MANLKMTLLSAICDASSVEEAYRDLSGELSVQAADRSVHSYVCSPMVTPSIVCLRTVGTKRILARSHRAGDRI